VDCSHHALHDQIGTPPSGHCKIRPDCKGYLLHLVWRLDRDHVIVAERNSLSSLGNRNGPRPTPRPYFSKRFARQSRKGNITGLLAIRIATYSAIQVSGAHGPHCSAFGRFHRRVSDGPIQSMDAKRSVRDDKSNSSRGRKNLNRLDWTNVSPRENKAKTQPRRDSA
jgi:hypothetical protein